MVRMSIPSRARSVIASVAVLAAVGGTVLAGCTAGGAASSGSDGGSAPGTSAAPPQTVPQSSTPNWTPGTGELAGLECASLQVPLNYADPAGKKISIALSMIPATAPADQRQGVMLVNPGGPGAAGRSLAAEVAQGLGPPV